MLIAGAWGISGRSFVVGYGIAVVLVAIGVWITRQRLLNGRASTDIGGLDVYELATLNGGPQLAVIVAAAKLHAMGALAPGATRSTVVVADRPAADQLPGEIEQELIGAAQVGITSSELCAQVTPSAPVRRMVSKLEDAGLLLDERSRSRLRRQWLWVLPLLGLGVARLVTGIPHDRPLLDLLVLVTAVAIGTAWLAEQRVHATAAGKRLLDAQRAGRKTLGHTPTRTEIPFAVALFGGGALWVADPAFASAFGIPREHGSTWTGGGGGCGSGDGGGGGGGCGGCGGCG